MLFFPINFAFLSPDGASPLPPPSRPATISEKKCIIVNALQLSFLVSTICRVFLPFFSFATQPFMEDINHNFDVRRPTAALLTHKIAVPLAHAAHTQPYSAGKLSPRLVSSCIHSLPAATNQQFSSYLSFIHTPHAPHQALHYELLSSSNPRNPHYQYFTSTR